MKRVRSYINDESGEAIILTIEEFASLHCNNSHFATFLRIQFEKGLITFNELLEICQIDNKEDFDLVDW